MTESIVEDVTNLVGAMLTEAGVAYWAGWDSPIPERGPLPPVAAKTLPTKPDACLGVQVYGQESEPQYGPNPPTWTVLVQVRTRAPGSADFLADKAKSVLHGLHNVTAAGVHLHRCRHLSLAQLGEDPDTGLDERTDNYELHVTIP